MLNASIEMVKTAICPGPRGSLMPKIRALVEAAKEAVRADGRRCPKCGAMIDHLDYWEREINCGEYWPDGSYDIKHCDVEEFYFLCPECGKVLFDDVEIAGRFLKGQPIKEDDICPDY
jgi:ribosomal protein S27AE